MKSFKEYTFENKSYNWTNYDKSLMDNIYNTIVNKLKIEENDVNEVLKLTKAIFLNIMLISKWCIIYDIKIPNEFIKYMIENNQIERFTHFIRVKFKNEINQKKVERMLQRQPELLEYFI